MIGGFVLAILVGLGLFLILRYFWLWYWKIDKIVELLEGIDAKLMVLKSTLTNDVDAGKSETSTPVDLNQIECPLCHTIYDKNKHRCTKCGRANTILYPDDKKDE